MKVVVIGGGPAGMLSAISAKWKKIINNRKGKMQYNIFFKY